MNLEGILITKEYNDIIDRIMDFISDNKKDNPFYESLIRERKNEELNNIKMFQNDIKEVLNDDFDKTAYSRIIKSLKRELFRLEEEQSLVINTSMDILRAIVINNVSNSNKKSKELYYLIPLIVEPVTTLYIKYLKANTTRSYDYSTIDNELYNIFVMDRLSDVMNLLVSENMNPLNNFLDELIKPEEENLLFNNIDDFLSNKKEILKRIIEYYITGKNNDKLLIDTLKNSFEGFLGFKGHLTEKDYNELFNKLFSVNDFRKYSDKIKNIILNDNLIRIIQKYNGNHTTIKKYGISLTNKGSLKEFNNLIIAKERIYESEGNFLYFERYTEELCRLFADKHKEIIVKKLRKSNAYKELVKYFDNYSRIVNSDYEFVIRRMTYNFDNQRIVEEGLEMISYLDEFLETKESNKIGIESAFKKIRLVINYLASSIEHLYYNNKRLLINTIKENIKDANISEHIISILNRNQLNEEDFVNISNQLINYQIDLRGDNQ